MLRLGGLLFDPSIVLREPLAVLAVIAIIMVGKSVAAFLIVLAFRYPVSTALTVSASLAQIGEFSFILAGLGVTLGLLPAEGRDLILAGALLSITLNPVAFAGIGPIMAWLRRHPMLLAHLDPSTVPELVAPVGKRGKLRDHAILVGYGRVGSVIGPAPEQHGLPFGVVERDRRILEIARAANPGVDVVVRTHSEAELRHLESQRVGRVVMGERELAMSMLEYTLCSLGVPRDRARLAVNQARGAQVSSEGT